MEIIVKSGIQPVHGFDLWGTLVIQDELGPKVIEAYKELSRREGVDAETIIKNAQNYDGVLNGKDWAIGNNKKQYVEAVEKPVWQAYANGGINVNVDGALYQDSIQTMEDIVKSGEGVCVITTGKSFWIKQAITDINQELGDKLGKVYYGNKKLAQTYIDTISDIQSQGGKLVTHTEDQAKDFKGLLDSGIKGVSLIYVERANLATP